MITVGLELGANVVKLAVVESARGSFRVRDFEVHRLDHKRGEEDVASILQEAFTRLGAPKNQVVASVRSMDCMIRELVVPFTDEDKIRKTVKYQAEGYFSSVPIDELIVEYAKFAELENKSKLLTCGIKKSHIERRLRFLGEVGVDPLAIDLDMGAIFNTYHHAGLLDGKGAVILVDIEADVVKIGVVENGKLRLARAVRMRTGTMGLEHKEKALPGPGADPADSIVEGDESARLPVVIMDQGDDDEHFSLEDSAISETERQGIIHRIFMEIDRTVATVNMRHDVDEILLSGPSASLEGIEELFSEHFEIDARRADVGDALELEGATGGDEKAESDINLQGLTAIGLALKAQGVDFGGLDFRREEFAYQGAFEQLKKGLATSLVLVFALVFVFAFSLKQELGERDGRLQAVKEMQKSLYVVLFPSLEVVADDHLPLRSGKPEDRRYYQSLKSEKNRLMGKFQGAGDSGERISSLEILKRFANAKAGAPPRLGIEVFNVRIDPKQSGRSTFECWANNPGAGIAIERALQTDDLVIGKVRNDRQDKKTGKWRFEIEVKLKEAN